LLASHKHTKKRRKEKEKEKKRKDDVLARLGSVELRVSLLFLFQKKINK